MRLPCHLRRIRGDRTLREIADQSGVNPATLSQIERGIMVPRNDQLEPLEHAYGATVVEWYDRIQLLALDTSSDGETL